MDLPQRHGDTELERLTPLTFRIIGAAIEVHRALGPGLLEALYEKALCIELEERGIGYARQVRVPAFYKGRLMGEYRVDLVVDDAVVVEVKSLVNVAPVVEAQVLTYLRLIDKRLGLLINFNSRVLKDGIKRLAL